MDHNEEISELIGSRICHDLVSPIGAIGNGLELMHLTGPSDLPELALIRESVNNANTRLQLFRWAFGKSQAAQQVGQTEIIALLNGLSAAGRLNYHWKGPETVNRQEVQAICLAMMCLEAALPYGGEITIIGQGDDWVFNAAGRKITSIQSRLLPEDTANTQVLPRDVQFLLLPGILSRLGRQITLTEGELELSLAF